MTNKLSACLSVSSRKSVSPVKAPDPNPVPEEDFFILEEEAPLLFRIPRTMSSSQRHNGTSTPVLDSQTSQRSPEKPSETVGKEQKVTDATKKLQSPVINELKKKTNEKVKKSKIPEPPESPAEKLCPPVDHAAVDRLVHKKPIKKQSRVQQVYWEQIDNQDVECLDTAGEVLPDLEKASRKMTKKSKKNTEVKKPKAAEQKKVKMGRKGAKGEKEMPQWVEGIEDNQEQSSDDHGQADQPASLSGNIQIPKLCLMSSCHSARQ